jgi:hypothetical protein
MALAPMLLDGTALAATPGPVWTSTAQFGQYTRWGYTWNNDEWNLQPTSYQKISVTSVNNWGVVSNQPFSAPQYPDISWAGGNALSGYPRLSSSECENGPGNVPGVYYEAAYDIWLNAAAPGQSNGFEIMVWTDIHQHGMTPGSFAGNVTIAGVRYAAYEGQGGNGPAVWLLRTSSAGCATTNLYQVVKTVVNEAANYTGSTNPTVSTVQFGWEIGGTGGVNRSFGVTAYAVTS